MYDHLYISWFILLLQIIERVTVMFSICYVRGHVQVFDFNGNFLFSADNEKEAREELKEYAQFAS